MSLRSSYFISKRSNTIHWLESGRKAQAKRPTASGARRPARRSNRRPAATPTSHGPRPARDTSRWSSSSVPRCPSCDARGGSSSATVPCGTDAPTKAAKKSSVIEPEASGAFGFSGSRSGPRSVLVWSTPTSNAQFSFHLKPCVRPKFAKVRGPYSVACVLMLDFTCVRSHGRVRTPTRVMSASSWSPFGVFVLGEQRRVVRQVVVDAEDAARRIVDARVLAAERSRRATPRSVTRPSQNIDAAGHERLVGDALVAARVVVGHVAQAGARRCNRPCSCARRHWPAGASRRSRAPPGAALRPTTMNVSVNL